MRPHALRTALAVLIIAVTMSACFSAPVYQGASDNFNGAIFVNPPGGGKRTDSGIVQWMRTRTPETWAPRRGIPPGPPPPKRVTGTQARVTFINHATTLIQVDGLNILTDPIWSERCSPISWVGPQRHVDPGLRFEDLPPIDVVLISHNHYDHLDIPTLKRLQAAHNPRIFAGLGNQALFELEGIPKAQDMDWWDSADLSERVKLTAVPGHHFSGRGLSDRNATLWLGFVLETSAGPIYFAGDTGHSEHFQAIRDRFGPIALAFLPIGAFKPTWFMAPMHISPKGAVRAHQILDATTSVAIHFGTFQLSDEGQFEPVYNLYRALRRARLPDRAFWVFEPGQSRVFTPGPKPTR